MIQVVVMATGKPTARKARAMSAGLKKLKPRPPNSCLPMQMAKIAPQNGRTRDTPGGST